MELIKLVFLFISLLSLQGVVKCEDEKVDVMDSSFLNVTKKAQTRIVGGTLATPGQFPFMVYVTYNGAFFCPGSIISRSWILTSAFCLTDNFGAILNIGLTNVVVNSLDSLTINPNSLLAVRRIVLFPFYDPVTGNHDIALLRLSTPLTFSTTLAPIQLPSHNYRLPNAGVVVGWGSSSAAEFGAASPSQFLRSGPAPVLPLSACIQPGASHIICAGTSSVFTCLFDAGDPLVTVSGTGVVVGAIAQSYTNFCATSQLFTLVAPYRSWIYLMTGL